MVAVSAFGAGRGLEAGEGAGDGMGGNARRRGGSAGAQGPDAVPPSAPENGGKKGVRHSGEIETLGRDHAVQLAPDGQVQIIGYLRWIIGR